MHDGGPWKTVRDAEKLTATQLIQAACALGLPTLRRDAKSTAIKVEVSHEKSYTFTVYRNGDLRKKVREEVMQLCRENMKSLYESTPGGWNEVDKCAELFDRTSRLIIVSVEEDSPLLAFVNWRFDVEECDAKDPCSRSRNKIGHANEDEVVEVAYCYELQVSHSVQGQRIGHTLMHMLEAIAETASMRKVILTVFKSNKQALAFYHRNKYEVDRISPSQVQGVVNTEINSLGDYEIMSKCLVRTP